MKTESILIIFMKNLVYGKVKTRLAATVGNDKAYEIYKVLISHTYSVSKRVSFDKIVFYSDHIENNDLWNKSYRKKLQEGNDLGERMMNAFDNVFQQYAKAVIIGTDCPGLKTEILMQAFELLDQHDVVIGPANDGGYYLLGMKLLHRPLFENIAWSTHTVLDATVSKCRQLGLSQALLPALNDVDEEKDLHYLEPMKDE